jgi:hypothetical protein
MPRSEGLLATIDRVARAGGRLADRFAGPRPFAAVFPERVPPGARLTAAFLPLVAGFLLLLCVRAEAMSEPYLSPSAGRNLPGRPCGAAWGTASTGPAERCGPGPALY